MGKVKIIAGTWRGRTVATPPGDCTRPTAHRARETLFSMLTSRLGGFTGLRVADLFAGSGAVGLEALSRGAAHCLFVERDRTAITVLRDTLSRFAAEDRAMLVTADAMTTLLPSPPFDLVLIDAPYGAVDLDSLIGRIIGDGQLAAGGMICAETDARTTLSPAGAMLAAERRVGKARLHLFSPA